MANILAVANAGFLIPALAGPAARGNIREFFSLLDYIRRKKIMFFSKRKTRANNVRVVALFAIILTFCFAAAITQFRDGKNNILRRSRFGYKQKRDKQPESDDYTWRK